MALLLKILPPPVIRLAGRLQFRFPWLRKPINWIANRTVSQGPGKIRWGAGRGLWFNAADCNPGFLAGTSEPLEQQLVADKLGVGDVFYDVGANAGFYATIAARCVGQGGRVYAFEPTPSLAARVRENADLNDFRQVEVVESAVGSITGHVEFAVFDEMGVQNAIRPADEHESRLRVACTTLDDFVTDHEPPSLVMMDIEGAELDALQNSMQMIEKFRPTLMIEVHWLGQPFIDFVETRLKPIGYTATQYDLSSLPQESTRYHCLLRPRSESSES